MFGSCNRWGTSPRRGAGSRATRSRPFARRGDSWPRGADRLPPCGDPRVAGAARRRARCEIWYRWLLAAYQARRLLDGFDAAERSEATGFAGHESRQGHRREWAIVEPMSPVSRQLDLTSPVLSGSAWTYNASVQPRLAHARVGVDV